MGLTEDFGMVCGKASVRVVGARLHDTGSMGMGGCVRDELLLRINSGVRCMDAIMIALTVS